MHIYKCYFKNSSSIAKSIPQPINQAGIPPIIMTTIDSYIYSFLYSFLCLRQFNICFLYSFSDIQKSILVLSKVC